MYRIAAALCFALLLATGCASTESEVTKSRTEASRLPYPSQMLVVTELNTDVQRGAEETAEAIVELLRPRMEAQGWVH